MAIHKHSPIINAICIVCGLFWSLCAYGWGQKGHDVTCAIAQEHLTRRAAKQISGIFDGKSLVYWSNWLDNASHTDALSYTSTWHYMNIDAGTEYDNCPRIPEGDVLSAIDAQISALRSGNLTKDESALALKMLIHLVGDLHCPMHLGHLTDKGGNRWQAQYFGTGTNLHSIWDSGIVESAHKWGYEEWAKEIDTVSKSEIRQIVKGNPHEWGRETYHLAAAVYDGTPVGSKLSYDYVSEWTPILEQQLLYGGLRLASILNGIFK